MATSDRSKKRSTKRIQIVLSEKGKVFLKRYLSPKGERLLAAKAITKEDAWRLYGKNKYVKNPDAIPVKTITHSA